jgi:hypothetical protein
MFSSVSHSAFRPLNTNLKSGISAKSLNSPDEQKAKPRYSSYFERLSVMTKKFERVQREARRTHKKVTENMKKNLKTLEDIEYSVEEDDGRWKEQLQMFKEQKDKKMTVVHKLKALNFPEVVKDKEPIKRMKAKNELEVPDRPRVSVSEIYSNVGKYALMKNKRNFGQVRAEAHLKGKKFLSKGVNRKSISSSTRELPIIEKVKILPKLAKKIKDLKGKQNC